MDSGPDHDFQRAVAASLLALDERTRKLTHAVLGIEYLLQVIFTMTQEQYAADFGKNVEDRAFVGSDVPDEVLDRLEGFWNSIKKARYHRAELQAETPRTTEDRLQKVEQETGALGCLLRVAYTAHPASRALLGEAIDRGEKAGCIPDEFTQAYRRFQREVGAVVAERTKQRRATRATKKAQAAAATD